jgi:hypothetical protein
MSRNVILTLVCDACGHTEVKHAPIVNGLCELFATRVPPWQRYGGLDICVICEMAYGAHRAAERAAGRGPSMRQWIEERKRGANP